MEKQKTEEYCLKANSIKEAVQALNALPLSEEEKVEAIVFGTFLYDFNQSVNEVINDNYWPDSFKRAFVRARLKILLEKYTHKKKGSGSGTPDWVTMVLELYNTLNPKNRIKNLCKHKSMQ